MMMDYFLQSVLQTSKSYLKVPLLAFSSQAEWVCSAVMETVQFWSYWPTVELRSLILSRQSVVCHHWENKFISRVSMTHSSQNSQQDSSGQRNRNRFTQDYWWCYSGEDCLSTYRLKRLLLKTFIFWLFSAGNIKHHVLHEGTTLTEAAQWLAGCTGPLPVWTCESVEEGQSSVGSPWMNTVFLTSSCGRVSPRCCNEPLLAGSL